MYILRCADSTVVEGAVLRPPKGASGDDAIGQSAVPKLTVVDDRVVEVCIREARFDSITVAEEAALVIRDFVMEVAGW